MLASLHTAGSLGVVGHLKEMNYYCSYVVPDKADSIELGLMNSEKVIEYFENFQWEMERGKLDTLPENKIYYNPSIKIEDKINKKWIEFSIVGTDNKIEFYIFYMRRKIIKLFFGLITMVNEEYVSEILDITFEKAKIILQLFLNHEWEKLEDQF